MTQMIGRALRGDKAGGTKNAFVVSFIDEWKNKINWVNPEKLIGIQCPFDDSTKETEKRIIRLISIEKMEEFARIMDGTIDTTELEKLEFLRRIPLGYYCFSILEPSGIPDESIDKNYEVLLYDDTKQAYEDLSIT
jgi:superfamily II DNA or RNA helicase